MDTPTKYAVARVAFAALMLAAALIIGLLAGQAIVGAAADTREHLDGRADQIDAAVTGALA